MKTVAPKWRIEHRVMCSSGWKRYGNPDEFGSRDEALVAFDAMRREHLDDFGASGEWKLVLLGGAS